MARVEMGDVVDLECGEHRRRHSSGGATNEEQPEEAEEEEGSFCFSDADEGSCCSQFYYTADGSTYDDCSFACASESDIAETVDSRRASSAAESDCSMDLEKGVGETKVHFRKIERDCRICHLSFESSGPETGVWVQLGCSCKGDLASAHKHCAETWFKIKGNKICEICNSIARNVVGPNDTESSELQANEMNGAGSTNAATGTASSSTSEARSCWSGQKFLNFLLACMVFAFVISWLFHFNAPS